MAGSQHIQLEDNIKLKTALNILERCWALLQTLNNASPQKQFLLHCAQIKFQDWLLKMANNRFNVKAAPVSGYMVQRVPSPHKVVRPGLSRMLQTIRLAGNSMRADCTCMLKAQFGSQPIGVSAICMER